MARRTQYGNTPWGADWIRAIEDSGSRGYSPDGRLTRGKSYANTGKVRDIEISGSTVHGKVQGSDPHPYKVVVLFRPFTEQQKAMLMSFLASNPMLVTDFLRGTIPLWFLAWAREHRLPLLPASWSEVSGDCSCPDWGSPCKHQVAVMYALANDIDRNPLHLFHLRGVTTDELQTVAGNNDAADLVPTLEKPHFMPFPKNVPEVEPENWHKDWLQPFEKKNPATMTAFLPPKPRFSTAQTDFREVMWQLYTTLSEQVQTSRTSGKNPDTMPHLWLQYSEDEYLWQAYLSLPDNEPRSRRLAYQYGEYFLKLPFMQKNGKGNSTIQLEKILATTATMGDLIEECSDIPGFSTKMFHTPSSRFFCAMLDLVYMLVESNSYKPVLVSVPDGKLGAQRKKGSLARGVKRGMSAFGMKPNPQYCIRYEPFVQNAVEVEALQAYKTTLQRLMPPEAVINDDFDRSLSEGAFDTLLSEVLTSVVHRLARPLMRNLQFTSNALSLAFISATPLQSGNMLAKLVANDMHEWLSWLDVASMEIMPVLRIDEPSEETMINNPNAPFILHCEVQDRTNALAQAIPIRQVLNAKGKVLGVDAEKVRVLVMRSLDVAAKHSSELAWMLDARNAERGAPVELPLKELYTFLTETATRLRELGVGLVLPQALVRLVRPRPHARAKSKEGVQYLAMQDLLSFEYSVALGDEVVSVQDFRRLLKDAKGIIRFRNSYMMISPTEAQSLLAKLEKGVKLKGVEALRAMLAGEEDGFVFDGDEALRRIKTSLTEIDDISVPASIHAQLRPYQVRGFQWMYSTLERGFGVVLADDMGLGKTLQTLTLLERLKDDGKMPHHALIICPTTLATNWQREVQKFAPRLSVSIYHGSERTFDFEGSDLVITTYGILRREAKEFAAHTWSIVVVDEAQNMKNHETAQTKAIKSIPAPMKVALSGTPVENRLSELWSLFDWLNHGYLYGITRFREDFAKPIEKDRNMDAIERLRRITAPFVLRRLKSDKSIIADLPDKIITNEYCTLTKEQAALYETTVQNALKALDGNTEADKIQRAGMIFSMITALKQICNHPANYTKKGNPKSKDSGKAARLLELLESMQEAGEKALIFTQYTEMGTLLEQMLRDELGIEALFFHGGITRKKRDTFVERFQNEEAVRCMIVSLKAGGTGLNLTAASNVIHYDLWWNPAVENQATDRAYRIGQMRNVQVHRCITQYTFEEKIDAMIQAKQELANLTVGTGENWITELSNHELREIFTLARS